jgi:hypothetical protein
VLSKIADTEGVEVSEADVDAEVEAGRARYAGDARLTEYFGSERGRAFIRSTLRRSRVVERIVDAWLADHPEHPPLPHLEDQPGAMGAGAGAGGHDHAHDHDHDHDHDHGADAAPSTSVPADAETNATDQPIDLPAKAG